MLGFVTRHPYGVVGGIVPWNVPLMLMGYKVAAPPGQSFVIKVPEQATYALIRMQQLFDEHLPADVCVRHRRRRGHGSVLATNDGVDKISFTGGVAAGRAVGVEAARPVTLESAEVL